MNTKKKRNSFQIEIGKCLCTNFIESIPKAVSLFNGSTNLTINTKFRTCQIFDWNFEHLTLFYVSSSLQVSPTACISTASNDITNNAFGFDSIFPKKTFVARKKSCSLFKFRFLPFDCQPCLVGNPVGFVLVIVNNVIFRFIARKKKIPFFIGASMFSNTDIFGQKR